MDKMKILVVDDTPENLQVLYQMLKDEYELFCATNGKDALGIAQSIQPDLILLDVMMPEMNGFEACRSLKMDEAFKNTPVLFLTALSDESNELQGFDAGGVDYITKPFNPMIVRRRISTHLHLQQQQQMLEKRNKDLEIALTEIKVLRGIIPICASCKKIRDDEGYWNQLEDYITKRSDAEFSHGICPACVKKLYPEHYSAVFDEEEKS